MRGLRRAFLFRLVGAAAAVVALTAVLAAASVAVGTKPFTATMSPTTFVAGGSGNWQYTITDADRSGTPSNQPLGSARITIPAGFTVTGVSAAGPPGKVWTASLNAAPGQFEVDARTQNDRLAGGQSVVVTISATATCSASSPAAWPIAVKQSNQFLGSGNDFSLDGTIPVLTTAAGAAGPLGGFSVTTSTSTATAGVPFTVTATALDVCNRVKGDYVGPAGLTPTGTLGSSPKAPPGDSTAPSYGQFGTWTGGSATASVTAKKAESGQTVTVTADSRTGTSPSFSVQAATLFPAFANQPADAQASSTIFSDVLTQAPVTVLVADVYGNTAPDGTSVSITGPAGLKGTLTRATSSGVASFGDLSVGTIGSYQLTAQVGSQQTSSATFQVVVALRICNGNTCDAPASSPNGKQSADTTISPPARAASRARSSSSRRSARPPTGAMVSTPSRTRREATSRSPRRPIA